LVIYNNELIPCSACVGTKNHRYHEIIENLLCI